MSDFRNIPDGGWRRLTRDLSPPAGLADRPFCLRRLTASQGRFNARTQGQAYHYPGMRIMASSPPRLFVCSVAALPIPPFLKMGSWPATVHTAQRISNVSGRPIQLPDCRQPAQSHRFGWICAEWRRKETCLNLRQIFVEIYLNLMYVSGHSPDRPVRFGRSGEPCGFRLSPGSAGRRQLNPEIRCWLAFSGYAFPPPPPEMLGPHETSRSRPKCAGPAPPH